VAQTTIIKQKKVVRLKEKNMEKKGTWKRMPKRYQRLKPNKVDKKSK
jgi:hypothetical protein